MDAKEKEAKKQRIDTEIDNMFADLMKTNAEGKSVAVSRSFVHGQKGDILIEKDPAFESWCKKYMGEEESVDENACVHCRRNPCIWDQEYDTILEICESLEEEKKLHHEIRFQLYMHMTRALHGRLGKGNRKELPRCVISEIHDAYPSLDYVGFKESSDTNNNNDG